MERGGAGTSCPRCNPGGKSCRAGKDSLTIRFLTFVATRLESRAIPRGRNLSDIAATAAATAAGEAETEGDGEKPKGLKRFLSRKMLMIVGVALVLLVGGGGGAYMTGFIGGAEEGLPPQKPAVFYDLPSMTVNLNSADKRAQYLKISISLELGEKTTAHEVEPYLPRILDAFQIYLREMRTSDLQGSAGVFRLKEDLQRRINAAIYPATVTNVLFKEILIQ
jgi:flagellar FliL protein